MIKKIIKHTTFILPILFTSCAGPTNPFGSETISMFLKSEQDKVDDYKKLSRSPAQEEENKVQITFYPEKQNWHDNHDVYVIIKSSKKQLLPQNLRLFWNHKDITTSFKGIREVIFEDKLNMIIKIKDIRLLPFQDNDITAYYMDSESGIVSSTEYQKPECLLKEESNIVNTDPFNVKQSFINLVRTESEKANINPNLLIALIAQESGFNPKAVSYAKAIGLTQVTELANKHILDEHRRWKSDSRIKKLPVPIIRALIELGKINEKNEWRLDRKKSVIGGIEYIKYLENYWKGNITLIERVYGTNFNQEQVLTDLILASYNSGPFRIKTRLIKDGRAWKQSKSILEARKYVGKIKSYCNHFASNIQEDKYENQAANL
ncbi:lytic transglycosylase domain-containing protein [Bacteriovorax sp. Seq25_V]|uniref:lytic transglycosylase domain-containing protein n=1 Tax=Bacteriovorax sp. Seq25_V TaxID=1201288 RepID=UPI00054ECF7F|nr:transglycosylase SLT domain-containing protein [Bacteriovorax sp. Seq25_V]